MIARKATSEDAENALGKEYALFAIEFEGLVSSLCRMELFSHFFESRPTSNKQSQRMVSATNLALLISFEIQKAPIWPLKEG